MYRLMFRRYFTIFHQPREKKSSELIQHIYFDLSLIDMISSSHKFTIPPIVIHGLLKHIIRRDFRIDFILFSLLSSLRRSFLGKMKKMTCHRRKCNLNNFSFFIFPLLQCFFHNFLRQTHFSTLSLRALPRTFIFFSESRKSTRAQCWAQTNQLDLSTVVVSYFLAAIFSSPRYFLLLFVVSPVRPVVLLLISESQEVAPVIHFYTLFSHTIELFRPHGWDCAHCFSLFGHQNNIIHTSIDSRGEKFLCSIAKELRRRLLWILPSFLPFTWLTLNLNCSLLTNQIILWKS